MKKKMGMGLVLILFLVIPGLLVTVSCAKKVIKEESAIQQPDAAEKARQAEMERQRLIEEERLREEMKQKAMAAENRFLNEDIHFEFDKYDLLPEAQEILKWKAEWLRQNDTYQVIVEGHCDERGTNEYNLGLGDRRANSAKSFLTDLGISPSRLTTISYGEERPLDPGHNESAWAKNRRAHFTFK
jgi:peptidoglycan-associated lipoprotein